MPATPITPEGLIAADYHRARFTPIELSTDAARPVVWGRIGEQPYTWHLIYDGERFAPLFAEHSARDGGVLRLLPTGGWWGDIELHAGDYAEDAGATVSPEYLSDDREVARWTPLEAQLSDPEADAFVWVNMSDWAWDVAYDGERFAPLFAEHSARDGGVLRLLPTGGWWRSFDVAVLSPSGAELMAFFNRTGSSGDITSSGEDLIGIGDTSSPRTITVSSEDIGKPGYALIVKDESGGAEANPIAVETEGSQTIDGETSAAIKADYGTLRLYSDGSNLFTW